MQRFGHAIKLRRQTRHLAINFESPCFLFLQLAVAFYINSL